MLLSRFILPKTVMAAGPRRLLRQFRTTEGIGRDSPSTPSIPCTDPGIEHRGVPINQLARVRLHASAALDKVPFERGKFVGRPPLQANSCLGRVGDLNAPEFLRIEFLAVPLPAPIDASKTRLSQHSIGLTTGTWGLVYLVWLHAVLAHQAQEEIRRGQQPATCSGKALGGYLCAPHDTAPRSRAWTRADADHHPPSRAQHAMHLFQCPQRVRDVKQRVERQHDVKGLVRELQSLGIHSLESDDVIEPGLPSLGRCLLQHPRRMIDPDDAPVSGKHPRPQRDEPRSGAHVQHVIGAAQPPHVEHPNDQRPVEPLAKAIELGGNVIIARRVQLFVVRNQLLGHPRYQNPHRPMGLPYKVALHRASASTRAGPGFGPTAS